PEGHGRAGEQLGSPGSLTPPTRCPPCRWCHPNIGGVEAEELLPSKGRRGSSLPRPSQSCPGVSANLGTLSVRQPLGRGWCSREGRQPGCSRPPAQPRESGAGERFTPWRSAGHCRRKPMVGAVVPLRQGCPRNQAASTERRAQELNKVADASEKAKRGFWEEFEVPQQERRLLHPRKEGQRLESKPKNRYKNVLPPDTSHVVLRDVDSNVPGADYSHANYIRSDPEEKPGQRLGELYVATPGCLPTTVTAFGAVLHQENTRVIEMSTREAERGWNECSRYWPELHGSQEYGRLRAQQAWLSPGLREESLHVVKHYQYLSWPDHGVPAEPAGVLGFLDEVSAERSWPQASPVRLHSAGIGHTGTITAIDILVDIIRRRGAPPQVHPSRSGTVQTGSQYKFVYLALQRYIQGEQLRLREQAAGRHGAEPARAPPWCPAAPPLSANRVRSTTPHVGALPADPGRSPGPAPSPAPEA
uniref:Uncharacterized protein n=1 Tax=Catagonus wagneri TaxID=51154 RepID=A0A8C3YD90_9CETA